MKRVQRIFPNFVSSLTHKNVRIMKKMLLLLLTAFFSFHYGISQTPIDPSAWAGMKGYWTFDDPDDLTKATVGLDLVLTGSDSAVAGPAAGNGATRIGVGSYYKCTHGISSNGGGSYVNEYSIMVDFRIPQTGRYYCFYQTNTGNSNDGDFFINPSAHLGLNYLGGYSYSRVEAGEWYRLVISVDLGHHFKAYLDGQLIYTATSNYTVDGRFSLDPYFYFFADENGEDNEFDVAATAFFNYPLSDEEASKLGGYGHVMPQPPVDHMNPYLQVATENSIYISWHSDDLSSTIVQYGTDSLLGQQATGTYDTIGNVNYWHTVHLTGLTPDTRYFYRCISGQDTSAISHFHTMKDPANPGRYLHFVVTGDSRTDKEQTHYISTVIEKQLQKDYGENWSDSVAFLINVGDIVTNGNTISQYKPEYFLPYSNLTDKIPFYVSIGNHEAESPYYYEYMKYEDLTGPPYEDPSSPFNEKFYTFRAGRCQFIALNSNWSYWSDEQTNWVKSVLDKAEADDDIDFVYVYCHHPGHTEIWPDGNTVYIQNVIIPLLRNYSKPAMLMYGHSHDYERGAIMLDEDNENYHNDMYLLLSGGGGAPLDRWGMYNNQRDYPEIFLTYDYYNYTIVDVDMEKQAFTARTYSLGNSNKPMDNVLVDSWYTKINQPKPDTPEALDPVYENDTILVFKGSAFSGVDSLFSSQIQLTKTPGDFSAPIVNNKRDIINIYGVTGAPDYTPIDKNDTVDITQLKIHRSNFSNSTYGWRIRYRDHNLSLIHI